MKEGVDKSPNISVILPVYNAEKYISEAVESILAQTLPDFELILIDDGSTDGSGAILDSYAERDTRIRVYHQSQCGLVAALNGGIDLARGEWIARMDADDIALPNRFAVQVKQLRDAGADFCGGAVACFGDGRPVWRYPEIHEECGVRLLFDVPFAHPAVIGRRSAFQALRYDPACIGGEDYDLWQRAWAARYRFTNVREVVLRYRVHRNQTSSRHRTQQSDVANKVRLRQWLALTPGLDEREAGRIVLAFGSGIGRGVELLPLFSRTLEGLEDDVLAEYLAGCRRIFMRVAGNDMTAVRSWWRLSCSANRKFHISTLRGMGILAFLSLFRIDPKSHIFRRMRRLKNRYLG